MFYNVALQLIGSGADNWAVSLLALIIAITFNILLFMPFYIVFTYLKWNKKK